MIILKMAFRNIFRQKRRSLLTVLMMAGGCFLFSFFQGLSDGTYRNIIDMFTRARTGHIQIHKKGYLDKPSIYTTINNHNRIGSKINDLPYVQSWAPRVYSSALGFIGKKTSGVRIIGVHPMKESQTTRIKQKIKKGRFISDTPFNEVIIGAGLAKILNAGIGDELVLISQGADGSIANELFKVIGFAGSSNDPSERMNCYMHIETAQKFLELGGRVHEIAVVLSDLEKSRYTANLIKTALNDSSLDIDPWQVVEKDFYRAMLADKKGSNISIFIIMIIVAVGVLNTVLMTILERTKEFGVLRALGTRPKNVFFLIVLETGFLAIISIIVGEVLGVLVNYILSIHGIPYPSPIEYGGFVIDKALGMVSIKSIILPPVTTIVTAILVSIYPAVRAARIIPVKALRTN